MAQGRSVWAQIFVNFINSLKPRYYWGEYVGKDHFGTEYFEIPKGQGHHRKPSRWFVPAVKEKFNQEIPPEWEAWLRHRRKDPPTEEEIQINLLKMKQTIENANKLNPPKLVEKPVEKPSQKSFPEYEEYNTEARPSGRRKHTI